MAHQLESHSLKLTPRDKPVRNERASADHSNFRRLSYNELFEVTPKRREKMEPTSGELDEKLRAPSFVDHNDNVEEDRYAYTFLSPPITPTCRIVDASMTIERVFDVDTVTQTFGVQVTVMMSWLMPDFEEPKPPEVRKNCRLKHAIYLCGGERVCFANCMTRATCAPS